MTDTLIIIDERPTLEIIDDRPTLEVSLGQPGPAGRDANLVVSDTEPLNPTLNQVWVKPS